MKDNEMQEHLINILNEYSIRTDLINKYIINPDTFIFLEDDELSDNDKWDYYTWVCKELKIKDRVIRFHGMNSEKASGKKVGGHNEENFFEKFGMEVKPGTNKTDLVKDGNPYASLKGGVKIQWGMHTITNLPDNLQKLFTSWISTFEKNSLYYDRRNEFGNDIVTQLLDKQLRRELINFYFRKNEEIPFLIVKDVSTNIYQRIEYTNLIDVLVDNLEFYVTKDKVKIVGRMDIGEKNKLVIFEIEPRTDKNNYILMHGLSERIIKTISNYNIDVKETYKQDSD